MNYEVPARGLPLSGLLRKMQPSLSENGKEIEYLLPVGEQKIPLNRLLGNVVRLRYSGSIYCVYCGRKTNKSFSQGYCFPCANSLARCDLCIMRPEICHFEQGTCREEAWALKNCFTPQIVYLASSSAVKVGITRQFQVPTRWIDQGALAAVQVLQVRDRLTAGRAEVALKQLMTDKTNWRKLLTGQDLTPSLNAATHAERLQNKVRELQPDLQKIVQDLGPENAILLVDQAPTELQYPVVQYLTRARTANFDKTAEIGGKLTGIRGQYLLLDEMALNVRKYAGYEIEFEVVQ